ncbi:MULTISPECIES: iron ABC transporter ATP-binding protein [Streptomyces]|uniref:ATP-binding cassette domain-containing protein n=1 Tax=Streptomyces anulatus TaxID=1892 RepID=A0A6G3T046_STRAQ|nr:MULTISPECIES: ATP-binding cassette domain-containing protein [Streptomyces]NEB88529.1 ATP-binding cassette domain-containing protein [Streptomyces anulatus]OKJ06425.1 iron ABC transporter ATP-binding protein [Streptomyces sp. TSRI0261]OWA22010.1 iron ABC transporter ATP-binding protein [Streptomyces sp. CS057]QNQ35917.1 ATP-binding cassette domain-containing protein [Streptomyces sp. CB00271]
MIEFTDIRKSYGEDTVLGPVSGQIPAGGITSLVGPNGAGKSTLLTIIGRLTAPTSGTVTVDGLDVHRAKSQDVARILSVLRQENHFTARVTVRELVAFGRFPHSRGRLTAACVAKVDEALDFLHLGDLQHRYLDQLSGGQRQRAYVAMVLAQDTRYVLLDEPLNNLDMKHSVRMMGQLRRAADELGKTVVLIVHDINFAATYSDRIVALREGRIAASGTVDAMMRAEVLTEVFDTPVQIHVVEGERTAVYYR